MTVKEVKPIKKLVNRSYEETVEKLRELMIHEGFNILGEKQMEKMVKEKLNKELYIKYTVILGCNPLVSKKALEVSPDVGLLFPCSFTVCEDKEGKVTVGHLSIMKTAISIGLAPEEKMDEILSILREKTTNIFNNLE